MLFKIKTLAYDVLSSSSSSHLALILNLNFNMMRERKKSAENEKHTSRQRYKIQSEINGNEYESSCVDRIVRRMFVFASTNVLHFI